MFFSKVTLGTPGIYTISVLNVIQNNKLNAVVFVSYIIFPDYQHFKQNSYLILLLLSLLFFIISCFD